MTEKDTGRHKEWQKETGRDPDRDRERHREWKTILLLLGSKGRASNDTGNEKIVT